MRGGLPFVDYATLQLVEQSSPHNTTPALSPDAEVEELAAWIESRDLGSLNPAAALADCSRRSA